MERRQISRVLISVSDKNKLTDFAKKLDSLGIEIVSTGGTSKAIEQNEINVTPVEKTVAANNTKTEICIIHLFLISNLLALNIIVP